MGPTGKKFCQFLWDKRVLWLGLCEGVTSKNLWLPGLSQKIRNKCFYTLCTPCAISQQKVSSNVSNGEREFIGVYITPALHLAVARGYTVVRVYEIWHYWSQGDSFSKFVHTYGGKSSQIWVAFRLSNRQRKSEIPREFTPNANVHVKMKDAQNLC